MDVASRRRPAPVHRAARALAALPTWTLAVLVVCGLALPPHGAAAQFRGRPRNAPRIVYGWCQFADGHTRSVYYSSVFAAPPGPGAEAAGVAFVAYLKQNSSLSGVSFGPPAALCQWRPDLSAYVVGTMQDRDKSAAILRNRRVVNTGWAPP